MRISDFDFALPAAAIAQHPPPERDGARLLLLRRGNGPVHRTIRELPELLAPGDLIVLNRSRVFPARLIGRLRGGGSAELLLLRDVEPLHGPGAWEALVRPGRRLRPGDSVDLGKGSRVLIETRALGPDGRRRVRVETPGGDPRLAIERIGWPPLPPYIRRAATAADRARYQTVYARESGSVAAPTAGLHLSEALLARLAQRGVERAELVLHVGPGTFQPVRSVDVADHRVASEPFAIPPETAAAIGRARARGGRVVAVGTTVVRALESAATDEGLVEEGVGETALVVVPGFHFRVVDALLTNFHLPRSSLLLLVCAFAGRSETLSAYAQALRAGYRFYSYGDAMLIV